MFATKTVPLHVFSSREQEPEGGCRLEGSGALSLQRVRWEGSVAGTEKVDVVLPLLLATLGRASLMLSIGTLLYRALFYNCLSLLVS